MRKVLVFGSAARGDDTEGSDLDLLVDMPADTTLLDMVGLQDDLCTALGIHVDVVTANDLPDRVRTRVLREARPL
ncbi:MAG: nucleotidyltransferase family protein [Burkholderiales bacterium]